MEKQSNALIVMNVILMLLVVGLGVYLVVDKTQDKENKPVDSGVEDKNKPSTSDNDKPNVSTDKLSETFKITVDGKKRDVKVSYKLETSENEETLAKYVATVYYDNHKLVDYEYFFDKVVMTQSDVAKYTVSDFKNRITVGDFKIIKGTNGHEFLAIYSHKAYESGGFTELYVFNADGGKELVLTDNNFCTFEDIPGYGKFTSNYTKINNDSVTFLAVLRSDHSSVVPDKFTVSEYEVTFGNKLTFTKTNTYKNISTEGDTPMGLNENVIK